MHNKKTTSFNHQVFQKSYKRLNLSSTQRIVYQRLLGFLLRNDKPFPYSAVAMSEITGFSLRTIFYTLNQLENLRLIKRNGLGKNRKFSRGTILDKIITTVQNRVKVYLVSNNTTVQPVHQYLPNRATGAYKKTSSFLKHNKRGVANAKTKPSKPSQEDFQEYAAGISGYSWVGDWMKKQKDKQDANQGTIPEKVVSYGRL